MRTRILYISGALHLDAGKIGAPCVPADRVDAPNEVTEHQPKDDEVPQLVRPDADAARFPFHSEGFVLDVIPSHAAASFSSRAATKATELKLKMCIARSLRGWASSQAWRAVVMPAGIRSEKPGFRCFGGRAMIGRLLRNDDVLRLIVSRVMRPWTMTRIRSDVEPKHSQRAH